MVVLVATVLPYSLVLVFNFALVLPNIFGFFFDSVAFKILVYFSLKFPASLCSCFFLVFPPFVCKLPVIYSFPFLFSLVFFSHSICICCHFAFISCCLVILLSLVLCVVSLVLNPALFPVSCILYPVSYPPWPLIPAWQTCAASVTSPNVKSLIPRAAA